MPVMTQTEDRILSFPTPISNYNLRRAVLPNRIPVPTNADELCTRLCLNDEVRSAAHLTQEEFRELRCTARTLAREAGGLNLDALWSEQTEIAKQRFVTEARKQLKMLDRYVEFWPLTIYITKYLENTKQMRKPYRRFSRTKKGRQSTTGGSHCIPIPAHIKLLSDPTGSTGHDFLKATQLDENELKNLIRLLQKLAHKYLDISLIYAEQCEIQKHLVQSLAIQEVPLLATRFEEAWPVKAYLTRYLRKKVSRINAQEPHRDSNQDGYGEDLDWGSQDGSGQWLSDEETTEEQADEDWDTQEGQRNDSQPWGSHSRCPPPTLSNGSNSSSSALRPGPVPPRGPFGLPKPPIAGSVQSAPVQQFLQSLRPNLERYLSQFVTWGIEDRHTLLSFKQWSPTQQERLLAKKLNRFEICTIQNGLDDLY